MIVNFEKKFEEALEEELKGFDIDRSFVEIKHVRYQDLLESRRFLKSSKFPRRLGLFVFLCLQRRKCGICVACCS